ncbi:(+)-delta-cadinene synthase isozyme A [Hibiscus syriacus]|uniref:(+)-delta-cadinene synthase n=1 Tax=Hibiscus syriacus TaxID=106335 RepID=A0A6A3AK93_HIBSY|nr:(-)-germacrene D synthase-like [Hibiscus syriacus]KAE8703202.1 (+)-delta-cadinene synthase isozyme A [Hibiscus syriacus]
MSSSASAHRSISSENRRSADFHPSVWGDIFLSRPSKMNMGTETQQEHDELKQEIQRMLMVATDEPSHKSRLIDTIKRIGVSYLFEREIEDALQDIHHRYQYKAHQNLEDTSLMFRLLRENGFNVESEIFNKFKDENGNFNMSLTRDVKGLLQLYEASHLNVDGEHILEEALAFTTTHLEFAKGHNGLSALVSHALNRPIRRSLPRLEARHYISLYQQNDSHHKTLLKFAKLDFNLLQNLHKEELSKISRWWKDLDFVRKLPFARDRLVECYFWILGVYFEPQYSFAREILTKAIVMASTMDDIYDVHGTFEELQLLTNAIERWDTDCFDQLPKYMKIFYKAVLDLYEEMEEVMTKQGKSYRVQYAKAAMKQLSQAYFVEAKWYNENYAPTVGEYMENALVSSGYIMVTITSFVGMGDDVTEETFNWASNNPKIVRASSMIARLMDDIVSHKFEQERGHVASAVECYTKQHGVSEEKACEELKKLIDNAWKDINHELLIEPTAAAVPLPALTCILNLARVMDFLYKGGDGYTHVGNVVKTEIASLLIHQVPI